MAAIMRFILFCLLCKTSFINGDEGLLVFCRLMGSCVLPCSFQGELQMIQWMVIQTGYIVHTYVEDTDKLINQYPHYTNRTSLFVDEISGGNASLLLTKVKLTDEGRYNCFTSSSVRHTSSTMRLRVHSPVVAVELKQEENELRCRSEGIYPQPDVSWSPPSEPTTIVSVSQEGLYSVVSSVPRSHSTDYSCNISTQHSWRRATLVTESKESDVVLGIIISLVLATICFLSVWVYDLYKRRKWAQGSIHRLKQLVQTEQQLGQTEGVRTRTGRNVSEELPTTPEEPLKEPEDGDVQNNHEADEDEANTAPSNPEEVPLMARRETEENEPQTCDL